MFEWLKSKRELSAESGPRLGRRGICIKCGEIKSGSFVQCVRCGFGPIAERDCALSLALNEVHIQEFNKIAKAVASGSVPILSDGDLTKMADVIRKERLTSMLGLSREETTLRDKVETLISELAKEACRHFALSYSFLQEKTSVSALNKIEFFQMIAFASEMGNLGNLGLKEHKDYATKAYPYRLVHAVANSDVISLFQISQEKLAETLPTNYLKTKQILLPFLSMEPFASDFALSEFAFLGDKGALAEYQRNCPGFFHECLETAAQSVDRRSHLRAPVTGNG